MKPAYISFLATLALISCASPSAPRVRPVHYEPHASARITDLSRTVDEQDDWTFIATLKSSFFPDTAPVAILHFGPQHPADYYNPALRQFHMFLPPSVQPLVVSSVRSPNRELQLYFTTEGTLPTPTQTSAYLQ